MKKYAVIVAGGKGKRMGYTTPKQFLPLNGKSILLHTIDAFRNAITDISLVVVLPDDQIDFWNDLVKGSVYEDIKIVEGGKERTDSVKAGLKLVPDEALLAIHDAVRPFASTSVIQNAFQKAEIAGSAVPVVPLTDSLRSVNGEGSKAVDRSQFLIVQTPQVFHAILLKDAYQKFKGHQTDDASVWEAAGFQVNLVEGNKENIKITEPADLIFAEAILKERLDD